MDAEAEAHEDDQTRTEVVDLTNEVEMDEGESEMFEQPKPKPCVPRRPSALSPLSSLSPPPPPLLRSYSVTGPTHLRRRCRRARRALSSAPKALKVAELKELLAAAGLPTTGTKAVLLERLEQHEAAGDGAGAEQGAPEPKPKRVKKEAGTWVGGSGSHLPWLLYACVAPPSDPRDRRRELHVLVERPWAAVRHSTRAGR